MTGVSLQLHFQLTEYILLGDIESLIGGNGETDLGDIIGIYIGT